jgi:hypothetical protein
MDPHEARWEPPPATAERACYSDGLGCRTRSLDASGQEVETFRLCQDLAAADTTEAALVERARRLASFNHPSFAPVWRVERVRGALGGLAIVSPAVPGTRLADLLRHAQRRWIEPDLEAAAFLLTRVADGIAALHQYGRDLAHGALGPNTVVVRPDGKPVIVDYVLGPTIERRELDRTRLWTQFRIPAPSVAGSVRLDQLTDVVQLGVLALTLVLGRPLQREEFPHRLVELLDESAARDPLGTRPVVPRSLWVWICRALQFENRTSFRTGLEAAAGLDFALAGEHGLRVGPTAVTRYLGVCMTEEPPTSGLGRAAADPADLATAAAVVSVVTGPPPSVTPPDTIRVVRPDASGDVTPPPPTPRPSRADPVAPAGPAGRSAARSPRWLDAVRKVREAMGAGRPGTNPHEAAGRRSRPSVGGETPPPLTRQLVRVAALAAALAACFGVSYLGARGYLELPGFRTPTGTLVVDSRPAGAEVYVDGRPDGRTPETLELAAGDHTLTLRTPKSMILVPVTVVAGARQTERIELRGPRRGPGPSPARASLPGSRLPQ